ncbi:MAG TPA: TIGR02996 domain-containing protein [Gemmata sp.]
MTQEEQFIAALHPAPREDTLRLVYADWLDERAGPGDPARAEFIRFGVAHPGCLSWAKDEPEVRAVRDQGAVLCAAYWRRWRDDALASLGASPLAKWSVTPHCSWAYRRGLLSLFQGTRQVLLDAWHDLFQLGPIEEVHVGSLWQFGTISSLRIFLDRPSVRVLSLTASEVRPGCVEQLCRAADWFRRLDRVWLNAGRVLGDTAVVPDLRGWLASDPSLSHVTFATS